MTSWLSTPEVKVGLLVAIVSSVIAVMSLRVSEKSGFVGGKEHWFLLDNAAGLIENGGVNVAGIKVGVIDEIRLSEGGQARVTVLIRGGVRLPQGSKIQVRANGILGDKQVEIIPGDPSAPLLKNGEQIVDIDSSASLDSVIAQVGKITDSLTVVADNLKEATEGNAEKPLGKIIRNVENLTGDLAELVRDRKQSLGEIVDNIHAVTETLNQLVNDESDQGLKQAWPRVVARIDRTMKNLDEIMDKVNSGEGTVGRLINDEETVDELNSAIQSVNNLLTVGERMETAIDFHTYQLSQPEEYRTYFGVYIQPGADRFYEVGFVSDPEGVSETKTTTTTPPGTAIEETVVYDYESKFTALFGKYFYNFAIKGGFIQNEGGIGIEYQALRRRFRLGVEVFDFEEMNVRPYVKYEFYRGLYVMAGGEHRMASSDHQFRSWFVGGGLFLNNEDLKFVLSRIQF